MHTFVAIALGPLGLVKLLAQATTPNIVVILADGLGYGEVSCNNPRLFIQSTCRLRND